MNILLPDRRGTIVRERVIVSAWVSWGLVKRRQEPEQQQQQEEQQQEQQEQQQQQPHPRSHPTRM